MARTKTAQELLLEAQNAKLDTLIELLTASLTQAPAPSAKPKASKVSEPKAQIENGYKARRARAEGGSCSRCGQTFAYASGRKWHNRNRKDCAS